MLSTELILLIILIIDVRISQCQIILTRALLKQWHSNGLENLGEMKLSAKGITAIDDKAFDVLSKLKTIYLNDNLLATISPGTFNGLVKLQLLYLSGNILSSIDEHIFNIFSLDTFFYTLKNSL